MYPISLTGFFNVLALFRGLFMPDKAFSPRNSDQEPISIVAVYIICGLYRNRINANVPENVSATGNV